MNTSILSGCLAFLLLPFHADNVVSAVVLGDVSFNNVIGIEESISALQTAAGNDNPDNLNVSKVCSAYGTYWYDDSTDTISYIFTHSSFTPDDGPPLGVELAEHVTFQGETMTLAHDGGSQTYTRKAAGDGGPVTGGWQLITAAGDIHRLFIRPDGSLLFVMYSTDYAKKYLQHKTITIDGIFTDWGNEDIMYTDEDGAECGNAAGQDLQQVYLAQDDNFIYIRYILNGPPDVEFGYKFGQIFHTFVGKDASTGNGYIFYTTPIEGVAGSLPPDSYVAISDNQIEFKVDLCQLNWDNVRLDAWLDDHDITTGITTCQDHVELPPLRIDRSSCQ